MDNILIWVVAAVVSCAGLQADGQIHLPVPTPLNHSITRAGCGSAKVCIDDPTGCDPSGDPPCFFISSRFSSSRVDYELSGSDSGYVGLGLVTNLMEKPNIFFVCANNNGSFFFQIIRNNGSTADPINNSLPVVNGVQGSVSPSRVQCTFSISNTNKRDVIIIIIVVRGEAKGPQLGAPTPVFNSTAKLDLSNTSALQLPMSSSVSVNDPGTQVLVMLFSVLSLYLHFN